MKQKLTGPFVMLGDVATCPNIEYLCGFRAHDQVALLVAGRHKSLVVPEMELGRARIESRNTDILTPLMLGLKGRRRKSAAGWISGLLDSRKIQRISVPPAFPAGVVEELSKTGIKVAVYRGNLVPGREVKSPDEIRRIRQSQQAAVIAMRAAIKMIADSNIVRTGNLEHRGKPLTSEYVRKQIHKILVEHDCVGTDTIVSGGRQSADPHAKGSGRLHAHEPIVLDIFPRHTEHGYWGDLSRTVCRGSAPPELIRMYRAVRSAQAKALQQVRARVRCATVHGAAAKELKRRGFETRAGEPGPRGFIHSTGHGVGLSIHEAPSVSLNGKRLRTGNVITIEPGLYYPDIGGIRIEDTIAVTATGWKYLAPCEKKLEI